MSKPETVFKVGAIRASIFRNVVVNNGRSVPLPKVVIEVRYKDKMGEWKGTNSLSLNDTKRSKRSRRQAIQCALRPDAAVVLPPRCDLMPSLCQ